jgi:anti-sigma B factor antagonist
MELEKEPLSIECLPSAGPEETILKLTGPMVLENLFGFQDLIRREKARIRILDLTGVPHVDSAGVGVLVGACVSSKNAGARMALVGVNQRVRVVLEHTNVDKLFHMFSSVEEARQGLAALAASGER